MTTQTLEAPQTFADAPPSDRPTAYWKLCYKLIPSRAILEELSADAENLASLIKLCSHYLDYSPETDDLAKTLRVTKTLMIGVSAAGALADKCEAVKDNLPDGAFTDSLEQRIFKNRAEGFQRDCYQLEALLDMAAHCLKANVCDVPTVSIALEGAAHNAELLTDDLYQLAGKFPESAP